MIWYVILLLSSPPGSQSLFFLETRDYMADFFNPLQYSEALSPYDNTYGSWYEKAYPPLNYLLGYGILRLGALWVPEKLNVLSLLNCLFMTSVTVFLCLTLVSYCERRRKMMTWLMINLVGSGLFLSAFERGQMLIPVVGLCCVFLFYYRSKDIYLKEFALLCLAVAAALKGSPAILGLLVVFEKDYKSAFRLMLYGVVLGLGPFLCLKGGFSNVPVWLQNVKDCGIAYALQDKRLGQFQHLQFLNSFLAWFEYEIPCLSGLRILSALAYVFVAAGMILAGTEKCEWRRILLLFCCMIFSLQNCNFYNALYVFPVIVIFLNTRENTRMDWFYMFFFLMQIVALHMPYRYFLVSIFWDIVFAELLFHAYWNYRKRAAETKMVADSAIRA